MHYASQVKAIDISTSDVQARAQSPQARVPSPQKPGPAGARKWAFKGSGLGLTIRKAQAQPASPGFLIPSK